MILLYYSVFLPRLIYNAEAWSSLTEANIQCLLKAQLHYLRRVLEIPKSTPTAALFLDLGILPIQYEIEKKQLLYLKCVLKKNADDLVQQTCYQMLEYQGENNRANHLTFLLRKYNLPLNDYNLLAYCILHKMHKLRIGCINAQYMCKICTRFSPNAQYMRKICAVL